MNKMIPMPLARLFSFLLLVLLFAASQTQAEAQSGDGIALAPARFELEMTPGSETTVVVNLDYHTSQPDAQPYRLVASLNDWSLNEKGELGFYKAGARPDSAAPWIIYSPAEVTVQPGQTHSIRVTITVPKDAAPGDHLAALIVEQRPDTIKLNRNVRQMVMRFRMASMFYITVPRATRRGALTNLQASADARGIVVTPTLKNEGNSAVRPISSIKVVDAAGRTIAELPESESLPVLAGSTLSQPLFIEQAFVPGTYTVKYRVDFQDGGKVTEGVTDFIIKENAAGTSAPNK